MTGQIKYYSTTCWKSQDEVTRMKFTGLSLKKTFHSALLKGCFPAAETLKLCISVLQAQERLLCFGPCCEDDWCFSSRVVMTHKLSWQQTTKALLLPPWGSYQESHRLSYTHRLFLGPHKSHTLSDIESHLHKGWRFPSITSMYSLTTLHKERWTNKVKFSWQGLSTTQLPPISLSAAVQMKVSPRCSTVHLVQMLLQ